MNMTRERMNQRNARKFDNATASHKSIREPPRENRSVCDTPCVAAVAAIRRELGGRWVTFVILFQCVVAWLMAGLAYLIANAVIG